jgi:DNA polymerase-3 subunit gamma/tau
MSYQVLARKYRPRNFVEMVGQEHVLRALINALDQDRLHHAYLFTGTRGVGKTTIARILAKCLNCEQGITSKPCDQCSTCVEINEGRSVDLIEVDAASRTRVEDTRELLENVQYMPTRARFKVYLIDEVHMLSNHSFNALLKTLEEPPEHVKFLLATTTPKKLPITVLSRCLQFNLKNMSPELIVGNLQHILAAEEISHEEAALWRLARAADGSMRDALSLTDQAIAYGNDTVNDEDVINMLGAIDQREVYRILDALVAVDAAALLERIAEVDEYAPDYANLLAEIQSLLHRIAVAQAVPESVDNSQGDRELIVDYASRLCAEDVHLFYQIGLIGLRDLPLVPDARSGFEMVLLRMLAFQPDVDESDSDGSDHSGEKFPESAELSGTRPSTIKLEKNEAIAEADPSSASADNPESETTSTEDDGTSKRADLDNGDWLMLMPKLKLKGVTRNLAANCGLVKVDSDCCRFVLSEQHASLWNRTHEKRMARELSEYFDQEMLVKIDIGTVDMQTPAQYQQRQREQQQAEAVEAIESDENIRVLLDEFGGTVESKSISPVG